MVNVIIAGLGGQGAIKASDILADAAFRAGLDVKKAEIHGMSQRGGSVSSDVRFGDEVLSPMIPRGEADFVLVLAPSEVEVVRPLLRAGRRAHPARRGGRGLPAQPQVAQRGAARRAGGPARRSPEACWLEAIKAALPERLHERQR